MGGGRSGLNLISDVLTTFIRLPIPSRQVESSLGSQNQYPDVRHAAQNAIDYVMNSGSFTTTWNTSDYSSTTLAGKARAVKQALCFDHLADDEIRRTPIRIEIHFSRRGRQMVGMTQRPLFVGVEQHFQSIGYGVAGGIGFQSLRKAGNGRIPVGTKQLDPPEKWVVRSRN